MSNFDEERGKEIMREQAERDARRKEHLNALRNKDSIQANIFCPNCGQTIRVVKVSKDKPKKIEGLKCKKCGTRFITWEYHFMAARPAENWYPRYGTISITGEIFGDLAKIQKYNEKNFDLSNK